MKTDHLLILLNFIFVFKDCIRDGTQKNTKFDLFRGAKKKNHNKIFYFIFINMLIYQIRYVDVKV